MILWGLDTTSPKAKQHVDQDCPFSSGCVQQWRRLWLPDLIASFPISFATREREQEEEEEQESKKRGRSRNHDWVPEAEQGVSAGKSMSGTWEWWEIVAHIISSLKTYPQVALPVSKSVFLALAATNPHLLQHQQPPRVPSPEVNLAYKNFCIDTKYFKQPVFSSIFWKTLTLCEYGEWKC